MGQLYSDSRHELAQKIAKWKAGLADLGRRNPLIKFRQDNLRSLEILSEHPTVLFKQLTEEKKFLYIQVETESPTIAQPGSRSTAARNWVELETRQLGHEQLKRLKKLRSEARISLEEKGVNSLFLAFGTLTWYDKDKPDEALLSPLILVPVELIKEPKRDVYKISILEEDIILNPTLSLKLKQTFGIELPGGYALQETPYSELITQIQSLVLAEKSTWQIQENIFLSLFSYAKAAMVRDIIENEDRIFAHPILQAISGDLNSYQLNYKEPLLESALDSQVKPEQVFQILDADSSQQVVIEAAKSGSSFFVQGPPGTGKSQTIVNMIAELIGSGKSVLLVAEKDTALRVVYERMVECGLNHVCLNLHHSGTTDKRKFVGDLSKTIKYIEYLTQNSDRQHSDDFFTRLGLAHQAVNLYLTKLHIKEEPLNKSPFELFGEILKKEREGIPKLDIIMSNFSQWAPMRLQDAKSLLNHLAQFPSFFNGEKTTIWAKSSFNDYYSYELELSLRENIENFQLAITSIQEINNQLQIILEYSPLCSLESSENCSHSLSEILSAPLQVPENWTEVEVSTARQAFEFLVLDVNEIEKKQLSQEASDLLNELSNFLPFLREDITTIWAKSNLQSCSESQQLELSTQFEVVLEDTTMAELSSQKLNVVLNIDSPLNLEEVKRILPALEHILTVPSVLPDDWSRLDINAIEEAFKILRKDIDFLEKNEPSLQQKYSSELLSSELFAINSRFKSYSKFWFIRVFNPNYRRDIKQLKKLYRQQERISHNELKSDLERALLVQTQRNGLYKNDYPAAKTFGKLFNPQFSTKAELDPIEQALTWLTTLQKYPISATSLQNVLNSSSTYQELIQTVELLKRVSRSLSSQIDFVIGDFQKTDIFGGNLSVDKIPFSDLASFLNLAISDLPKFREWIVFKKIHDRLENLGVQEFIDALREDRDNPIVILQNKLNQPSYLPSQVFSPLYSPTISKRSDLQLIQESLDWLVRIQPHSLPSDAVQNIIDSPAQRRELTILANNLKVTHESIQKGLDFLLSYFNGSDLTPNYRSDEQIEFFELSNFLDVAQSELPDFQGWLTYKEVYEGLQNLGTQKFLDALRSQKIDCRQWFPSLENLIYQTCLEAILARKPELKNFNIEVHERQIKEFASLDYGQLDIARERLKQIHAERWQNWERTSVAQSELPRLKKEETKKKQHLPIRKLLNDHQKGIQNLVKILKPCWMMSPLSVSQYIDPNVIHFDVLIFDEASQLRTEDVISSIIRSDQVIVIGDRKQLPPTSFFSTGDSEEDIDDEDDESYESILDECSNFMFGRTLKWHYRSQDERLIAFSNLHFYDSKLVTFPNPTQNPDLGVWFKHVPDGIYDRGKRRDNQREAAIVAQLVLEHSQKNPKQSLGIIAFSEAQADAIQEQIEILGRSYPNLEAFCSDQSSKFFLKALENVQGDERDVIILSVGYARDSAGKLSLNFGPLNKRGGERRLNVAVTRAKQKITLVSSILAGDIDLARTNSEGVRVLRDYLEYAASGGERLQGNSYTNDLRFDSPFEENVYDTLKDHPLLGKEYTVRTQVGCSGYRIDLAIANNNRPGEFLLGIECDGASYHSSHTARDRDRLRQQVLEKLGWCIHRIWSTEWFRNKPEQVRFLIENIKKIEQMRS